MGLIKETASGFRSSACEFAYIYLRPNQNVVVFERFEKKGLLKRALKNTSIIKYSAKFGSALCITEIIKKRGAIKNEHGSRKMTQAASFVSLSQILCW